MEQSVCKQIEAWVEAHEREILEDVKHLVSIRSVAELDSEVKPYGEGCRKVMEEYCRLAAKLGYKTVSYGDRVIRVDTDDKEGQPGLGIWNHLDVVPEGHDWRYEPFAPIEKEGLLIGRGVRDNKGPAVAALYGVKCLEELGLKPGYKLSLYAGLEEEKKMSDISWMKENGGEFARYNLVMDSRFPVCYGEKGILNLTMESEGRLPESIVSLQGGESRNSVAGRARMEIRVPAGFGIEGALPGWLSVEQKGESIVLEAAGLSQHAAHPENSENAITRLFGAVSGREEGCGELSGKLLAILGQEAVDCLGAYWDLTSGIFGEGLDISAEDEISGKLTSVASMTEIAEGKCRVYFDIRYPISLKGSEGLVERVKKALAGKGILLVEAGGKAPGYVPKESPLIGCLMDAYNSYMGENREPFTIAGGTYARMLPGGFGYGFRIMPEIPYPEGVIPEGHGGNHSADEAVVIEGYKKQLVLLIVSLAETAGLEL